MPAPRSRSRVRGRAAAAANPVDAPTGVAPAATAATTDAACIILNPFHGGSHRRCVDTLLAAFAGGADAGGAPPRFEVHTLPGKKWHWRLLVSAVHFAQVVPRDVRGSSPSSAGAGPGTLFVSSLLNLADLVALRGDLARRRKILYFHENQFAYPSSQGASVAPKTKRVWSEYGWAQVMSCLAADRVLFNSEYNRTTFLAGATRLLAMVPGPSRPENVVERIAAKSQVLHYPMPPLQPQRAVAASPRRSPANNTSRALHVVWPHRWEHDKGPDVLLRLLQRLHADALQKHYPVRFSVLGERFPECPAEFDAIRAEFWTGLGGGAGGDGTHNGVTLRHMGYVASRAQYENILRQADVVLSTARHEFFGVSTLEAVRLGCLPVCPDALAYPELYPASCLYRTETQLFKRLRDFARRPDLLRSRDAPAALAGIRPAQYELTGALREAFAEVLGVESVVAQNKNEDTGNINSLLARLARATRDNAGAVCLLSAACVWGMLRWYT